MEIGEQISTLERRAMEAERDTVDRYVAAFLADRVGQIVRCRITGVQPFGFFATVEDWAATGWCSPPTSAREYFRYDEKARTLVGDESGETYRVGQRLDLQAGRGQSGFRRPPVRISRGQLWRARHTRRDRVRMAPRPQASRAAGQYPASGQAPNAGNELPALSLESGRRAAMANYKIAIIVGSLREGSINRKIAAVDLRHRGDNLDCSMV